MMIRILLLLILIISSTLYAHPNLPNQATQATTIAELTVHDDHLLLELEIGGKDQPVFQTILAAPTKELTASQRRFFERELVIEILDHEEILYPEIVSIQAKKRQARDPITGEPTTMLAVAKPESVMFVVLKYPFEKRPTDLRILPPRGLDGPKAMIAIAAYHRNLPINDFGYLNMRETIRLDWSDPWYTRFRGPRLGRYYQSPLSAFVYVDPKEVRLEVVVRNRLLKEWLGTSTASQFDVRTFFEQLDLMQIDGVKEPFTLDQIQALNLGLGKIEVLSAKQEAPADSGLTGVIYVLSRETQPTSVQFTWPRFSDRVKNIPVIYNASGVTHELTPSQPSHLWTIPTHVESQSRMINPPQTMVNLPIPSIVFGVMSVLVFLRCLVQFRFSRTSGILLLLLLIPMLSVRDRGLVSFKNPFAKSLFLSEEDSKQIVDVILNDVYHAFDFRSEEAIYDTLSRSISGDLLKQSYLDVRKTLEIRDQSTRARVKALDILQLQPVPLPDRDGFQSRCRWRIRAMVSHWGHVHERTTEYEADIRIEVVENRWKMTAFQLLDEKQASP
jgi:hypothetical protein